MMALKSPPGTVFGDLPPKYQELGSGGTLSLPISFQPAFLGVTPGIKLRIVVRAWRSETDALGITKPVQSESFALTSAPFVWVEEPINQSASGDTKGIAGDVPGGVPTGDSSAIDGLLSIQPRLPRIRGTYAYTSCSGSDAKFARDKSEPELSSRGSEAARGRDSGSAYKR